MIDLFVDNFRCYFCSDLLEFIHYILHVALVEFNSTCYFIYFFVKKEIDKWQA